MRRRTPRLPSSSRTCVPYRESSHRDTAMARHNAPGEMAGPRRTGGAAPAPGHSGSERQRSGWLTWPATTRSARPPPSGLGPRSTALSVADVLDVHGLLVQCEHDPVGQYVSPGDAGRRGGVPHCRFARFWTIQSSLHGVGLYSPSCMRCDEIRNSAPTESPLAMQVTRRPAQPTPSAGLRPAQVMPAAEL